MNPVRKPLPLVKRAIKNNGANQADPTSIIDNALAPSSLNEDAVDIPAPDSRIRWMDGYFGLEPKEPSLLWELSNYCAKDFMNTLQYLYGKLELISIFKTVEELSDFLRKSQLSNLLTPDQVQCIVRTLPELLNELGWREFIQTSRQGAQAKGYAE
jgi:hypothetical protein